jgi:hypothetical protein
MAIDDIERLDFYCRQLWADPTIALRPERRGKRIALVGHDGGVAYEGTTAEAEAWIRGIAYTVKRALREPNYGE